MTKFPRSLLEFQRQFPDETACVAYLAKQRWPEGFVCPGCGEKRGWALKTKPWTTESAVCGRQTSVTAGTVRRQTRHAAFRSLPGIATTKGPITYDMLIAPEAKG